MGRIDVGTALSEGWAVFMKNMGPLIVGTLLMVLFSLMSFLLLAGVMSAGLFVMIRNGFAGRPVEITDVFGGFQHFCRFFWGGMLAFLVALAGLPLCCVGVLFTGALVVFLVPLMVQGCGPGEALGLSWGRFRKDVAGFLVIFLIQYGLNLAGGMVAFATVFTTPLGCCIVYAAYRQVYGDDDPRVSAASPEDVAPRGIPLP